MAKYVKGFETKANILRAARELFYSNGYEQTTVRQIAERSQTNLGLINYYFSGKEEIALNIYQDIRLGFNALLEKDYTPFTSQFYLMSIAIELYVAVTNFSFGRFYLDIAHEKKILEFVQSKIIENMKRYVKSSNDEQYFILSCVAISAMKPALTAATLDTNNNISHEEVLKFYLERYVHYLDEQPEMVNTILTELKKYYITVVDNFTPVLTKLIQ